MKRSKQLLLTALCMTSVIAGAVGITACNTGEQAEHEHIYSVTWSYDDDSHYHACTDEDCTSIKDDASHDFGEWTTITPATEDTNGQEKRECAVCDFVEYRDTEKLTPALPAAHTHSWGDWTVTDENKPTATTEGKATRTCSGTGECDGETADMEYVLPNLESTDYSKSADTATCTATGNITYTYNKDGVSVSFNVETPVNAEAHNYGEWKVTTPATCETDGEETRECECGKKETRITEATGHTYGEWKVTTPATCETDGEKTRECACGDVQTETIAATGHNYGAWVVTTPATCETDGEETRECECGKKETRIIGATGHTYGEWKVTTPATCETDGEKTRECACGDVQTETIAATGHAYGDWEAESYTSCGEENTLTKTCANDPEHVETITVNGHFMNSGLATGEKFTCPLCKKEYIYMPNQTGSSDDPVKLKTDNYYFEFESGSASSIAVRMMLELKAGQYEIVLEHLTDLTALISSVTLHSDPSDDASNADTRVAYATRGASTVQSNFINVATIEHTSNNKQTLKFTFDATNYAGKFLRIMMQVQRAVDYKAKYNMSVNYEKDNKLVFGDNEVSITETYDWVDEYKFVSTTEQTYSITVPAGVSVAVANKELDPNDYNYLTIILDSSSFMDGEDCYVDFTVKANEPVYFVFNSAEKGDITVTIGDEIGEKVPPILCIDEPFAINFADKEVANVLTVAEDVPEGEYLITLKYYSVAALRNFFYFTINGDDMQTLGAGTSTNYGNYKDFAVIVTLKAGDVLVFTTSGGTSSGLIDVTMSQYAPTE